MDRLEIEEVLSQDFVEEEISVVHAADLDLAVEGRDLAAQRAVVDLEHAQLALAAADLDCALGEGELDLRVDARETSEEQLRRPAQELGESREEGLATHGGPLAAPGQQREGDASRRAAGAPPPPPRPAPAH